MIQNILVPLDGSSLAEAALPGALWFAHLFNAKIDLLHVIETQSAIHRTRRTSPEE